MKNKLKYLIFIFIIISAAFFMIKDRFNAPFFENLDQELNYFVLNIVEKNNSIKNCVLSVKTGDGSFSWAGAAGIANQHNRVPMYPNTSFFIASITKLYTATAIMRLYEEGMLSLNDTISKYIPIDLIQDIHIYNRKEYSNNITIKNLLSHTSGIADYYTEKPKGGRSLFELILEDPKRSWTVGESIEMARTQLAPNFPPGTDVSYSDTNYQLLGKVIEALTGKPLHIVYDEFFFHPLALKHTWLIGHPEPQFAPSAVPGDVFYEEMNITNTRSNEVYWADGGIVSTAEDCIIFLKALNEGRIINGDTLKSMHQWRKLHFPLQYGYGTMYFELPWLIDLVMRMPPLWGHSGSTGSFLYYSEDLDLYMAGTINQTEAKSKPFRLMAQVIKAFQSKK